METFGHPDAQRVTRYSYRFISTAMITDLIDIVQSRESAVLLGAIGIGKQYVIPRLQERLTERNPAYRFCRLRCEDMATRSERSLVEAMIAEFKNAFAGRDWSIPLTLQSLRERLLECLRVEQIRLVFLVSNIDALPEILARQLLKNFREFTHLGTEYKSTVTVLITGSSDLAPLVYGANSEFYVRSQIVIQGFSLDVFTEQMIGMSRASGLQFEPETPEFLHCEVGGHHGLFRAVIATLLDRRRVSGIESTQRVTRPELQQVLSDLKTNLSGFRDIVIRPFARLESSSESLQAMQRLICEHRCSLPPQRSPGAHGQQHPPAMDPPTQLELCGVARREEGQLVWASPLMQSGGESYFNPWTLGDAFACCNDWPKALECYRMAERECQLWSASDSVRPRLSAAVKAFESRLFSLAGRPSEAVARLRESCLEFLPFLVGLEHVCWHVADPSGTAWRQIEVTSPIAANVAPLSQSVSSTTRLPKPNRESKDIVELRSGLAILEIVVPLPGIDGLADECVLMSNYLSELPIAGDRHTHAVSVGRALQLAYQNARRNEHVARQSKYREQLLEALPNMLRGVGGPAARMKQALETAGEALRSNGYRRVMFSMVDLKRRIIKGVIDCRAPDEVDIAEMTSYPLDVPAGPDGKPIYKDIQQKIVLERIRLVIDDAGSHPLTSQLVNKKTGLGGFVLIPLMQHGEVLGTMHVERSDRKPLDAEQVEALQYFADQVANAIDAMAWVDMLEVSTLEEPEAVVLIDEHWRVRYVNRSALKLFSSGNIELGWQDPAVPLLADKFLPTEIYQVALQSRETDATVSRYVKLDKGKYEAAVNSIPLKDWRDLTTGFLIQVRDLHGWNQVVDSFGRFAKATDFETLGIEVLLAAQKLGHRWARYYKYDEESKQLVGNRHIGEPVRLEDQSTFQRIVLPSRGQSRSTWLCFERRGPVVFQHTEDKQRHGEEFQIPTGLRVMSSTDLDCPVDLKKSPSEMWIDFAIMLPGSDQPLGKISLSCEPEMTLLEFEELRLLMEAAQTAFAAIAVRQEHEAGQSIRLRQMMLLAIGETCHHLKSRLASLATLTLRYAAASSTVQIGELNEKWLKRLKSLELVLDEAAEGLKPVKASRERQCIARFLREVFDEALEPNCHTFIWGNDENRLPQGDFPADFDAKLFQRALDQLIQNSRKAVGNSLELKLEVTLSAATRLGVGLCRIDVRDNGPGIPTAKLEEIFEDFFTEWPGQEIRGTGLGLSFVQSVVAEHRGRITALESASGAWFRIEFPRFVTGVPWSANSISYSGEGVPSS